MKKKVVHLHFLVIDGKGGTYRPLCRRIDTKYGWDATGSKRAVTCKACRNKLKLKRNV